MPVAPALPAPVEPPAASAPERQAPPLVPEKAYEQLVVSSDSVLGLQLESTVSSDRARVEDRVEARVTRNVNVGDRVAIPAGSRLEGNVTLVERGGKVRERGRLGIRFHTLVLPDGGRTAITTETVYREGESPAGRSAAKITGATAGGAILGAILGGRKGAAIGGAVGAAGGTAAVMAGSEQVVTLPAGTLLTVRLLSPVTVEVERAGEEGRVRRVRVPYLATCPSGLTCPAAPRSNSQARSTCRSVVLRFPMASRSVNCPSSLVCERNTSPLRFTSSSSRCVERVEFRVRHRPAAGLRAEADHAERHRGQPLEIGVGVHPPGEQSRQAHVLATVAPGCRRRRSSAAPSTA